MKALAKENSSQSLLPCVSRLAGLFVVAVAGLVLTGWILGVPLLIRLLPSKQAMHPVTAVLLVLAGVSLWRLGGGKAETTGRRDLVGLALAGLVTLGGALRLGECVFGEAYRVEQLLFPGRLATGVHALSEMAPTTASMFLLYGLALLLFDTESRRGFRPGQVLVLGPGLLSLLVVVTYSYQGLMPYGGGVAVPMALSTAICFGGLCLGFLAARPYRGLMIVITSPMTGGLVARRLMPAAILFPWVLGAVLLVGEQAGSVDRENAVSIFTVASIVIFGGLSWWNAKLLYLSDLERTRAEGRMAVQHSATKILAESRSLEGAAPRMLETVCVNLGWRFGALWTLEIPSNALHCAEVWHASSCELEDFANASRKVELAGGMGLPGRVLASGEAAWIPELSSEAAFLPAPLAIRAGLHSGFGAPIRLGDEVLGVLEFYSGERELAGEPLLGLLAGIGSQMGLFIERTRAEEQLRQTSANLARSNTDLQQFAYVASHDLFEPLRMVISYLQLLEHRHREKLDGEAREFIKYAVDGALRMQGLIQDLLAYSRVEFRGRPFQPTDCEQVFKEVISNLKVAIEEAGAVVAHEPLPRVRADSVQMTQVFQNLVGNALKFHGAKPPEVNISARQRDGEWVFSVRDNGIGIDPKYFDRIFEIFQRLHTRQEYSGTGMGLAICKRIVERHGGRIWVESAPGEGSTFFFTLPLMTKGN